MSDDVTIPREDAQRLVRALRARHMDDLADLLDPPQPTLRDEVAALYRDEVMGTDSWGDVAEFAKPRAYQFADAAIAIWRRHVEALDWASVRVNDRAASSPVLFRDDVLRLLGGDDD